MLQFVLTDKANRLFETQRYCFLGSIDDWITIGDERDSYREVPLNAKARKALDSWLAKRKERFPNSDDSAFFLNCQGQRLSQRSIDLLLRKLAQEASVTLSAHILRHTCLTN